MGVLLGFRRSIGVEEGGRREREVLYPAEESAGTEISVRSLKLLKG